MPRERQFEDVEFAAPAGARIKVVTRVSFGILAGFVAEVRARAGLRR